MYCRDGIYAVDLLYTDSSGNKQLIVPRTDFVEEICIILEQWVRTIGSGGSGLSELSKAFSLIFWFNSIYHHRTPEAYTMAK
jgi:hypothetical protein